MTAAKKSVKGKATRPYKSGPSLHPDAGALNVTVRLGVTLPPIEAGNFATLDAAAKGVAWGDRDLRVPILTVAGCSEAEAAAIVQRFRTENKDLALEEFECVWSGPKAL